VSNDTLPEGRLWPRVLYRYMDEAEYADAFVEGRLLISTLEACRRHDDPARGDPLDGVLMTTVNVVTNDPNEAAEAAAIMGIGGGGTNFYAYDNVQYHTVSNAYLICCSLEQSPRLAEEMGPYCVEILQPESFASVIGWRMSEAARRYLPGTFGAVQYDGDDRNFQNRESWLRRPHGLTKRSQYSYQTEFRLLWRYADARRDILNAPGIRGLCRRIA
jgi:hypothetical protein